jgi:type II secretory pathway pseudopilin PulG
VRLPTRHINARRRTRAEGYSLVEVIISILLASVIVTSVFSVVLTSKADNGQNGRNDRHQIAGQAIKDVSSALRNFVTGCCDVSTGTCVTGAGLAWSCDNVPGPNKNNGTLTWSFDQYLLATGPTTDSFGAPTGGTSNTYALKAGTHYLSGLLPAWFTSAPFNAQVSYTVSAGAATSWQATAPIATSFPTPTIPQVNVNVTWTEP